MVSELGVSLDEVFAAAEPEQEPDAVERPTLQHEAAARPEGQTAPGRAACSVQTCGG